MTHAQIGSMGPFLIISSNLYHDLRLPYTGNLLSVTQLADLLQQKIHKRASRDNVCFFNATLEECIHSQLVTKQLVQLGLCGQY